MSFSSGFEIAKAYERDELCGWLERRHPGVAKEQFDLLSAAGAFPEFKVSGGVVGEKKKVFLHRVVRKVLGKDTPNYPQEIGDCVSFGAKNATEYVTCTQILGGAVASPDPAGFIAAARQKFRYVFPPFYYGTGRVYVGGGRLGNEDGSLGSWMAEAVKKYGTLFSDAANVPPYSGAVAKAWGDPRPAPDLDKFKTAAAEYPVKATALIRSWDDLVAALSAGYPCPTASNVGYSMEPSADGFHRQTTNWAHQMCFIGVDETYKSGSEPYALILNNWGDVHGHLRDFDGDEQLPLGVLRVRRRDAEKHIAARETFAYSQFQGDFPDQSGVLDKGLFLLI